MNHSLFARAKRIRPILAFESAMIFDPQTEELSLRDGSLYRTVAYLIR